MSEATIKANGAEFALPDVDTLTMDEAIVLFDYSDLTLDKVADMDGLHPKVLKALVHIGYKRAKPDASEDEAREVAGAVPLLDFVRALGEDDGEGDAGPPEMTDTGSVTTLRPAASGQSSASGGEGSPVSGPPDSSGLLSLEGAASASATWVG